MVSYKFCLIAPYPLEYPTMKTYFFPIEAAAALFPILAIVLTLPYAIYCYRKYGSVSPLRTLILFSLLFYVQCAYFLVILPLPDPAEVAQRTGATMQLVPFSFVGDFLRESGFVLQEPSTWLAALKDNTVYEPLFNIALTLPWGMYLYYYFKQDLRKVVALSFVLSLFFELTQLSGLYGLYPRPYRLFDVDDLLLNTLGGVVGYGIATVVTRFLPSRERIDEKSRKRSATVGYLRRLLAYALDALVLLFLRAGVATLLERATGDPNPLGLLGSPLLSVLLLFVYSIGVPALFKGATVGKAIVRIRVLPLDPHASRFAPLALRYLLRNSLLLGFSFTSTLSATADPPWQTIIVLAQLAVLLLVTVDLITSHRKSKRLLYERISRTQNVSTVPAPKDR
ncbi:MAG: VanZ family protein [Coriobacteriales bacterium]|jgi:glycopeptide antibiotics resistance protein|nr:VanZ family protein [Coriobacteriales bacterium]